MWENFKESEFGKKIIKVFSNRGVVITTALVALVLTIAITATVATNRANKQNAELGGKLPTDTTQQTQKAPDTDALGKGEDTVPVYNEGNGTEQVIERQRALPCPFRARWAPSTMPPYRCGRLPWRNTAFTLALTLPPRTQPPFTQPQQVPWHRSGMTP